MKIRRCPDCAELVHFEEACPIQRCWNCARVTDFSQLQSPNVLLLWALLGVTYAALQRTLPLWARLGKVSRPAFLFALPAVVLMLLICNSFDIRIVHDLTASFSFPHL